MRLILPFALGLIAAAGAAHAQYQPIQAPKNPYALPQPELPHMPATPSMRPAVAPEVKPVGPPAEPGFKPFKPYKPITGVDTNTAPSGLYPELHKHKKKPEDGF